MKFSELLLDTIRESEIPLRFESGAEESVARPVVAMLKSWIASHDTTATSSEFEYGKKALVVDLLRELDDETELLVVE